ncbi:MAG: hypothetical protein AB1486_13905 [Planctomycetota bacterium]
MNSVCYVLGNPAILALFIPIVAVIVGGLVAVVHTTLRHRERMAMIERGMHPGADTDQHEVDQRGC